MGNVEETTESKMGNLCTVSSKIQDISYLHMYMLDFLKGEKGSLNEGFLVID